jgi:transcriptional regulator NrdR family protein
MVRWRRRRCRQCQGTWRTFESLINPAKLTLKAKASTS